MVDIDKSDKQQVNEQSKTQPSTKIRISLAYSVTTDKQCYLECQVQQGTTLYQALKQVGWLDKFIDLATWCEQVKDEDSPLARQWYVGVFSQKQPLDYVLQANDRIEVYRDLTLDPMNKRKRRAVNK